MNITTKSNQLILALMVSFFSLMLACKSKNEIVTSPNQPPGNFNVTSTLGTNGQDVILKWTKSKDPEGDAVTYSVVYTDTLAKNLSDTTFTIKNLPFETEIKGSVVAKDTKGGKTVSNFSIKTGSDYVTIPDVNFEKALIQFKIDDVQDGKVLRTSVLKVTSLSISSSPEDQNNTYDKIKDLTGIQEFVNLKSLKCVYSDLTSLDVSRNTALTELWCSSNQLTRLDVSKNLVITKLILGFNRLTNLDVSNNLALTTLSCDWNQLVNLDLGKNLNLTELSCADNKLKSLDVSKNTNLLTLDCSSNDLISLDISKNANLLTLNCAVTNLTNLDISKNLSLIQLSCEINKLSSLDVSKNTALIELNCQNNKLTDIDVNKNILLKYLWCFSNQLSSLDISKISNLTYLNCYNNKFQTICVNSLNQVTTDWYKDPTATYKVCP